jgi:hypothetical protein
MALAVGYDAKGLREISEQLNLGRIADYGFGGEARIPFNLAEHHGATHGVALHQWIDELLANAPLKGTKTFGDLEKAAGPEKLQVIGTDLAHTRMVVFPEDVKFYLDDHGNPIVPSSSRKIRKASTSSSAPPRRRAPEPRRRDSTSRASFNLMQRREMGTLTVGRLVSELGLEPAVGRGSSTSATTSGRLLAAATDRIEFWLALRARELVA